MRTKHLWRATGTIVGVSLILVLSGNFVIGAGSADPTLNRQRLKAAALYENQDYAEVVPLFRSCVAQAPQSAADLVNLGLGYYRTRQWPEATETLETARSLDSSYPHISYTVGLIHKKNEQYEEAAAQFEAVIAADLAASSAYYNLGVVLEKLGRDEDAENAFRATVRHDPNNVSAHYYLYKYAKAARRNDEARREMKEFRRLQKSIPDKERTEEAYEESPYLKPIIPPHQSFMPAGSEHRDKIKFVDVTEKAGLPTPSIDELQGARASSIRLVDLDGDNDLDLYYPICGERTEHSEHRLFLNDGYGHYDEVTDGFGQDVEGCVLVADGDFDNNGTVDFIVRAVNRYLLMSNDGSGRFTLVAADTAMAEGDASHTAAFVDYDHDGDLDLFTAHRGDQSGSRLPDACRLFRNNGDSSFAVIAADNWPRGYAYEIEYGDFDGDDDTDLLVANSDSGSCLMLNQRQGTFSISYPLGGGGAAHCAVGDLDNDGDLDVLLAQTDGVFAYVNNGDAQFVTRQLPEPAGSPNITAIASFDFDNDGLLDVLLTYVDRGMGLWANNGGLEFSHVTRDMTKLGEGMYPVIASLDAGDIDGDGDLDVVGICAYGRPIILENRGGEDAHWLEVQTVGERVPKQGIGAKIEIKAGQYYQRRDVYQWPVHFGLGEIDHIDVLRITWTNGIVQNMIDVPVDTIYRVEEIVRADASCPFLFAFDGERFNFINDILGVAAMGVPLAEDFFHAPDPDEYVKIKGELLKPSDDRYLLRLTGEFKELVYLDQIKLLAVDHPIGVDVYPNERFTEPPFMQPGLHTVKNRRHPEAAADWRGRDILPLITQQDQVYPSDIPMTTYDGLAEMHWFEFDLGDLSQAERVMLYLTGWIYWSSASANVAISQNGQVAFEAVSLSVPDEQGEWVQVMDDIGLPNGKNSTIPVDLSGLFPTDDYRIRLRTNMVVYWDELFFTVDEPESPSATTECDLLTADLHYRGFSQMRKDSIGAEFFNYHQTTPYGPWRQHIGRYTRYGDVLPLLAEIDDRYVIYGPGEEIALEFDAASADDLPNGWTRDFFLYAFGWIKDGDMNTVYSKTVEPLPFIGMPGYPYEPTEHPRAEEIARDLEEWLTRDEAETVEPLKQ